jgi:ribonuclease P protein component
VERNRAKRRLREAARQVDLRPETAYVVVASHEVLDARFGELVTWMDEAATAGRDGRKDGK